MKKIDLYPLKFYPIAKERIWGGDFISKKMKKPFDVNRKIGESWELSDVKGDESIVSNGELKGLSLREIIENYGFLSVIGSNESVFPILIKYIDANDKLSIQVHPDDEYAQKYYGMKGKTEMWVVLSAKENAKLLVGLSTDKNTLKEAVENKKNISNMFNYIGIKEGDVIYLPAGRVHAILDGVVIAEIQQTSDLTFRLYDWDRVDDKGAKRELHIKESFDVIKENDSDPIKIQEQYEEHKGCKKASLIKNNFFNAEKVILENGKYFEAKTNGSFHIIMLLSGSIKVLNGKHETLLENYETLLIPASLKEYSIMNIAKERALFLIVRR